MTREPYNIGKNPHGWASAIERDPRKNGMCPTIGMVSVALANLGCFELHEYKNPYQIFHQKLHLGGSFSNSVYLKCYPWSCSTWGT